jgi:hypothetical protein
MEWFEPFWGRHGETVITGILITVGAALAGWILLKAWKVVWAVVTWLSRGVYWLLIGWWVAKLRRWITGSPW